MAVNDVDPNAPTLCFCTSCMALGGAARARLRDRLFQETRDVVARTTGENARKWRAREKARKAALAR